MAPIAGLLLLCVALTVQAGPVLAYMHATARAIHAPDQYVGSVMKAPRTRPDPAEGSR